MIIDTHLVAKVKHFISRLQTLAALGDDVQQKYGDTFVAMTKHLGLSSATAYDTFAKIARRLFNDGINWGRIIALLCFGYEIAFSVIKTGSTAIGQFLKKIISFVVKFIVKEKIGKWIANQGGWVCIARIMQFIYGIFLFYLLHDV